MDPQSKKRKATPCKKWKESEIDAIVDYLHEERDFEHPTAQFYYKKLIEKKQLEATWDLVRWKVRYLKTQFKKANDWLGSTGVGVLEEDGNGNIEAKILKLCPHYNRLKEIFGKQTVALAPVLCSNTPASSPPPSPATPSSPLQFAEEFSSTLPSDAPSSTTPVPTAAPIATTPKTKAPTSAVSQLVKIQEARISFEKNKLDSEMEIQRIKIALEEKRIELEMKKLINEEKRHEQEADLKKLEMEMKERVVKYEIDKKYSK